MNKASKAGLDPVDYAVISQSLLAAAREMGVKLVRSSYSTIVREAQDASAALMDREGNVVAQAELIPMQLGPMSEIFRACARLFPPETLKEGEFYINNDPYRGGQHLQDVFIFSPIFLGGELLGFAGTVSHHLDIGGGNPGQTPDAVDVHAEGLVFPPSVYNFDRDWSGGPLERLIAANIRVPEQTIGDFYAQFAANSVGAERVRQLARKFGAGKVARSMSELIAYTERRMRAAIAAVPDGVYAGEPSIDNDGLSDAPLTVRAQVTVRGDGIAVDYAGTCPQVRRNLNCPWSSTVSATLIAIKSALTDADIPFNEGVLNAVSAKAPSGTLVNPEYPAPVRARMLAAYRCFDAVMAALAQAAPERAAAEGNDTTHSLAFSKLSGGGYRVYLEIYGGGFGATADSQGCDGVDSILSNCTNTPVEAMDMDFDFIRVTGYGLLSGSGGEGARRGGMGFFRSFEILSDEVNFTFYTDRRNIAPKPLKGGAGGSFASVEVSSGGETTAPSTSRKLELKAGDRVTLRTAGGAGYGQARRG
ncbi:MAG: hydantoinase B/oxoprolinase family protein [Pikeienuella sp.]